MSGQEQGQKIDPSRLISGRIAVTGSVRRARVKRISQRGEKVEVGGRMVKAVLKLHNLHSHRWMTRRST